MPRTVCRSIVWGVAVCLVGCAALPAGVDEARLEGDAIVLLGEVHDNPVGHAQRLALLQRAVERGWRPAIAMEQFDTDRQDALDTARREFPADARRVIEAAMPAAAGWDWTLYEPVVALVLRYQLPLLAANLPGTAAGKVVREGYAGAFTPERIAALGLSRTPDAAWQAGQAHEIDTGHCGMLPPRAWPAMARAQFARDAVMAEVLRTHAAGGIVLLAGNGHVRRDLGVPRWLGPAEQPKVLAIGFVEAASDGAVANPPAAAFDRVVQVAPAARADPCEAFAGRPAPTR